ncbi:Endonuclease/exonuclease/phosphatase [Truncatella angustata]|uniref:Endonuclease/exonuclease/phosphatase n=1 Tax=Truncatella angustata TaxID=152316 RepID=A0A9P8RIE6_9PEZI|nr:Endonuclease/exonuclease/phosphatase [Truncatella angustata]KAH6646608.1 Endonuclease/exonuclease/phosphatase [Truncatella angustata]
MGTHVSKTVRKSKNTIGRIIVPNSTKGMDEIIQKAIAHSEASKRTSAPWKADQPHEQQYFHFNHSKQQWGPQEPVAAAKQESSKTGSPGLSRLALFTWNIDFMLPYAESRMEAGLTTLQDLASRLPGSTGVVIFLQECVRSDLATISQQPWIRERFTITDTTVNNWASGHYGTTMLVDRRLAIAKLFRVHYAKTRMGRDAFFVDIIMGQAGDKRVRLCNSHLESLAFDPPYRPSQVQLISQYLRDGDVHAGIAAGDFNAIQDFDRNLHSENGLKDAYLERGGKEDSDDGYTWGQQAATNLRERFDCSRMDKVYFHGQLELRDMERFVADLQLQDPKQREHLVSLGFEKPWITDHIGVKTEFEVV